MGLLVKICGICSGEALDAALNAGADMIGLVFFPKSPRHVSLNEARMLADRARGRAEIVALTVDADDRALAEIVSAVAPDWLQCHGSESPERLAAIRETFGPRIMKAHGVATRADLDDLADYATVCDRLLIDAKPGPDAALPGGNGRTFDWTILDDLDAKTVFGDRTFLLSGGLTPDNAGAALHRLRANPAFAGLDVSSGVESAPGVKDPAKIAAFIAALRAADITEPKDNGA
jgi:phosphoribosylanthranilate isomerase